MEDLGLDPSEIERSVLNAVAGERGHFAYESVVQSGRAGQRLAGPAVARRPGIISCGFLKNFRTKSDL